MYFINDLYQFYRNRFFIELKKNRFIAFDYLISIFFFFIASSFIVKLLLKLRLLKNIYKIKDLDLRIRAHENEELDNLSLSGKPLHSALNSLQWVNSFFGNHRQLANAIIHYYTNVNISKTLRIVDIGCGGGDSIYYLYHKLKAKNISSTYIGIDGNAQSIAYAKAKYHTIKSIQFKTSNIINSKFSVPECDILISSHFIYHYRNEELVAFLKKTKQTSINHIIFSELERSKISYWLFKVFNRIFPISNIAKRDGLLAIKRSFTKPELENIIQKSGITNYKIHKKKWFRMLTTIDLQ